MSTVAEARARLDDLIRRRDAMPALSDDPALSRLSGRALRSWRGQVDRDMRRRAELDAAIRRAEVALRVAQAEAAEAERVRLSAADLRGATHVRDRHGWHEVVRVSARSVTVRTPYSWTERIPVEKVLEARAA